MRPHRGHTGESTVIFLPPRRARRAPGAASRLSQLTNTTSAVQSAPPLFPAFAARRAAVDKKGHARQRARQPARPLAGQLTFPPASQQVPSCQRSAVWPSSLPLPKLAVIGASVCCSPSNNAPSPYKPSTLPIFSESATPSNSQAVQERYSPSFLRVQAKHSLPAGLCATLRAPRLPDPTPHWLPPKLPAVHTGAHLVAIGLNETPAAPHTLPPS